MWRRGFKQELVSVTSGVTPKSGFHLLSRIYDSKFFCGAEHISDQNCHLALLEKLFCFPSKICQCKWEGDMFISYTCEKLAFLIFFNLFFFLYCACNQLNKFEFCMCKMEHLYCIAVESPSTWDNSVQQQRMEQCHTECFRDFCVPPF